MVGLQPPRLRRSVSLSELDVQPYRLPTQHDDDDDEGRYVVVLVREREREVVAEAEAEAEEARAENGVD